MILSDQPEMPSSLLVRISSRDDGTMLDRSRDVHDASIVANRAAFCMANGLAYEDMVYQRINYGDEQSYDRIVEVCSDHTTRVVPEVSADALFTAERGVGLFLPVADCVATVLYDETRKLLALLHLGRHSTLTDLIPLVIAQFETHGSKPEDLRAWMSPSAQRSSYRLEHFSRQNDPDWAPYLDEMTDGIYLDLQGYNRQRLIDAGVPADAIYVSPVDTMQDDAYFSHARGDTTGRMAVIASMR